MTSKIRVAVAGYGNIGKYAVEAIREAPDMELAGVVRRKSSVNRVPAELAGISTVSDVKELGKVDVALLCGPTRSIPETAEQYLALGINTVDSFDIHGDALWNLRQQLDKAGKKHNTVSIVSAGWDPGSDSVVRTMMEALAPKGITYTNFGPGMSMGHTVAVKSKTGVRNALSMTIPAGTGVHRRMVYVELEPGVDFSGVEQAVKTDAYFAKDHTVVMQVDNVDALLDMGHGVLMERKGVSGVTQNQLFEFRMKINNPALTAQIMTACGRATMRRQPGAYTMPEVPVMDLLPGDRETLVKKLV
ncbi:MAG: diaminopimelate dehydrogenase [Bacteroidales bacterium]|jgi:diaminopimelate dehydrogenase|nr:diaminopimelate dehydrogenase [Bacteroidales bacterium]